MVEELNAAILNFLFPYGAFSLILYYSVELGNFVKEIWQLPYILFLLNKLGCEKLAKSDRTAGSLIGRMIIYGIYLPNWDTLEKKGGIHKTGHWDDRCKMGLFQANRHIFGHPFHREKGTRAPPLHGSSLLIF